MGEGWALDMLVGCSAGFRTPTVRWQSAHESQSSSYPDRTQQDDELGGVVHGPKEAR